MRTWLALLGTWMTAAAAAPLAAQPGGTARRRDCLLTGSFAMGPIQLGMTQQRVRASLKAPTATRRERLTWAGAAQPITVLSYRGVDVGISDATDKVVLLRAVGGYRGTPNNVRVGQTRRQARAIMPADALPETGPDSLSIPSCTAGEGAMVLVFGGGQLRKLEIMGPGRAASR